MLLSMNLNCKDRTNEEVMAELQKVERTANLQEELDSINSEIKEE